MRVVLVALFISSLWFGASPASAAYIAERQALLEMPDTFVAFGSAYTMTERVDEAGHYGVYFRADSGQRFYQAFFDAYRGRNSEFSMITGRSDGSDESSFATWVSTESGFLLTSSEGVDRPVLGLLRGPVVTGAGYVFAGGSDASELDPPSVPEPSALVAMIFPGFFLARSFRSLLAR